MSETKIIKCPFCESGEITVIHTPGMMITRYGRASSNKKAISYFKDEKYEILSDKCPNCGKTQKEIQDFFEGKSRGPSHEALMKRIKESRLPTRI